MRDNKLNISKSLAKVALEMGAIKISPLEPFSWASGYRMPLYNDNRLLLSLPENRKAVTEGLLKMVESLDYKPEAISGCATGGIAPGVCLADAMNLPFSYVRASAKSHGLAKRVEGDKPEGKRVLVIEDLISTGGSSVSAAEALREAGAKVSDIFSVFSYGFKKADELLEEKNYSAKSLLEFTELLEIAIEQGLISDTQIDSVRAWQESPFEWGEKNGFPKQ